MPRIPLRRAALLCAAALAAVSAGAAEVGSTVTIIEGGATIVSGSGGYLPVPGLRLRACDIVQTGPQGLVQIELDDGGRIELGPDSRMVFNLPLAGEPVVGPHFLMSGWAKLSVPAREKAAPYRLHTPQFDLLADAGVTVLRVAQDEGELFVEQGGVVALVPTSSAPARVPVASGRNFARKSGGERGAVADGVKPAFVQGMPRAFRDTLPALLPQFKGRDVKAKAAPEFNWPAVESWVKSEPELRGCFVDATVRTAQEALERQGLPVGPIDGILGPRTAAALRDFQQRSGLAASGQLDAATLRALQAPERR
jgi:hypothetical protein